MAFQPATGCAEASIQLTLNGRPLSYRLTFEALLGTYDQTAIDALSDGVDDWFNDEMKALHAADCVYERTAVRGLESVVDLQSINDDSQGACSVASNPIPVNAALVVKFTTGFTGRSARGRVYMTAITNGQLSTNENFVNTTYATDVVAAWEALDSYVNTFWKHVVISRQINGVVRTSGYPYTITGYSLTDSRLDTRRKRLG